MISSSKKKKSKQYQQTEKVHGAKFRGNQEQGSSPPGAI